MQTATNLLILRNSNSIPFMLFPLKIFLVISSVNTNTYIVCLPILWDADIDRALETQFHINFLLRKAVWPKLTKKYCSLWTINFLWTDIFKFILHSIMVMGKELPQQVLRYELFVIIELFGSQMQLYLSRLYSSPHMIVVRIVNMKGSLGY